MSGDFDGRCEQGFRLSANLQHSIQMMPQGASPSCEVAATPLSQPGSNVRSERPWRRSGLIKAIQNEVETSPG